MKRILGILLCLFIVTTQKRGCFTLVENGDFIYYLYDNYAYIYELSDIGKTKQTIIFPNRIDGHNIGIGFKPAYLVEEEFIIESEELEKMYFNSDILKSTHLDKYIYFTIMSQLKEKQLYFLPYYNNKYEDSWYHEMRLLFISNEYANSEDIEGYNKYKTVNDHIKIANVSYYYNYDNDWFQTYFIDDVDGETIKNIPPIPIRDGYEFAGWYKEKECINKWDFENDKVPNKEYDEEENYKYNETILYAKWK